jgi:probable HAF family extracellular repeat protein
MGVSVEILQTTNISSKVTAIGGLPKSVFIQGISGDGSVVVGKFRSKQPPYDWQILRYTQLDGIEHLVTMGKNSLNTLCISGDGLVIWGTFSNENHISHIFRYTKTNGFQDLGTMGKKSMWVYGVSTDGSVIVGSFLYSLTPENSPRYHAFKYSQSQGFEDLGTMGAESAFARGISADGTFIVGNYQIKNSTIAHAFRYSRSDGVQDIGSVGGIAAFATGISNDGSVIVGSFFGGLNLFRYSYYNQVFIFTKSGGVQKLGAINGKSAEAHSISADGTMLYGSYIDSNDEAHIYTAKIVLPVAQEKN